MAKILVVDDEVQIRELLTAALSREGFDVQTATRADHAMALVAQTPFDLILLDLQIAGDSGLQVLKQLKQLRSKSPVVIYSGAVTPSIEIEARQAGAADVLHKDLGIRILMERVSKIIESNAPQSTGAERPSAPTGPLLIVDDEEGIRSLLRNFFKSMGRETIEAEDGETALKLAASKNPCAVLLDINLTGTLTGIDVLRQIRAAGPALPVMMMTGRQEDEFVKTAMDLGATGYMLKPFDFLYLKLVVMSKLSIAAGESS